mmetsp:Transcript_93584/g.214014  ORF Transcript_93584/g.214014 Transcript_93584/m.214014 type:complete len:381 (+) Transcript_93584:1442-2584(+)
MHAVDMQIATAFVERTGCSGWSIAGGTDDFDDSPVSSGLGMANFLSDKRLVKLGFVARLQQDDQYVLRCSNVARYPTSLRVNCPLPLGMTMRTGFRVSLEAFVTEALDDPGAILEAQRLLSMIQPLEFESHVVERRSLVRVCTQPLWGLHRLEELWPGHLKRWIQALKHGAEVGEAEVFVYTRGREPAIEGVTMITDWYLQLGLPAVLHSCKYVVEELAYDHCLYNARGHAEFIAVVHSPDEFVSPPGLVALLRALQGRGSAGAVLPTAVYDGPARRVNVSATAGALAHRSSALPSLPSSQSVHNAFGFRRAKLDRLRSIPIVQPESVEYLCTHAVAKAAGRKHLAVECHPGHVNHFVSMFGPRQWTSVGMPIWDPASEV